MSTRATIHFQETGATRAIIYRHSDGYPEGLGADLSLFFSELAASVQDNRFDDPSYLAAKYVVWQADRYHRDHPLNFLSLGVTLQDPTDIEYRYTVNCQLPRPIVTIETCRR